MTSPTSYKSPSSITRSILTNTPTPPSVSSSSSFSREDTLSSPAPNLTQENTANLIAHSQHILNNNFTNISKPSLPPIDLTPPITIHPKIKHPKITLAIQITAFIGVCLGLGAGIAGTMLGITLLGIAIGPVGWIL